MYWWIRLDGWLRKYCSLTDIGSDLQCSICAQLVLSCTVLLHHWFPSEYFACTAGDERVYIDFIKYNYKVTFLDTIANTCFVSLLPPCGLFSHCFSWTSPKCLWCHSWFLSQIVFISAEWTFSGILRHSKPMEWAFDGILQHSKLME